MAGVEEITYWLRVWVTHPTHSFNLWPDGMTCKTPSLCHEWKKYLEKCDFSFYVVEGRKRILKLFLCQLKVTLSPFPSLKLTGRTEWSQSLKENPN